MKIWLGICLASSVLALAGCSKDADCEAFIKSNDDLAKAAKDAKDPGETKKMWDDKKSDMKTKYDGIKEARGFQIKEENQKKLAESVTNTVMAVCDPTEKGYSDDVCKDYQATLGVAPDKK